MKPGARIAGFVIHTPDNLTAAARRRVEELMPMEVLADGPPAQLATEAGFSVLGCDDVTEQFRVTCDSILRSREKFEAELRDVDGDEVFEDDQRRKEAVLTGIDEGGGQVTAVYLTSRLAGSASTDTLPVRPPPDSLIARYPLRN